MFNILFKKFKDSSSWMNLSKATYIWIILACIYIPLIVIIFLSFTDASLRHNVVLTFEKNWNTGQNFHRLFFDDEYNGNFINGLINSVLIAVIVTPVSLIIGIITVFGVWRAKNLVKTAVLNTSKITIVNPDVITGISLATLFIIAFIPIGLDLGWVTIILAHISFTVPYVIVTIYPRIMKLNYNLVLASQDLNHSYLSTFFKVIIPYLLPSILAATLIALATSFDDFIITNLVRGRVSTLATELYSMQKGIKSWAITFGALIVFLTLSIIVLLAIYKYINAKKQRLVFMKSWFHTLGGWKRKTITPKFSKNRHEEMISRTE